MKSNTTGSSSQQLSNKIITLQNSLQKSSKFLPVVLIHNRAWRIKKVGGNSHIVTKHSLLPQTCSVLLLPKSRGIHTVYICIMNNTFYITYSRVCRHSLCTVYRLCNNNAKKFYAPDNSNQQMFAVRNTIISVKLQHSFNIAALCFSTRMRKSVTIGKINSLCKYSTNFSHPGTP